MNSKKLSPVPKNIIFSLDIGTRSVVGVLSKREGKKYVVIDHESMEHPDRTMFDGQIHDIMKVTDIVKAVVDRLEQRNGFKLEQAAIAAAGRALITERAHFEMDIDVTKEIDKVLTDNVEMQAIQVAQKKLAEDTTLTSSYYCVGYSIIQHFLDQNMILNPIGHRGKVIGVDIIATFLPHIVVDSLYAVIQKAGLEVMNLTLEPIAAMNVAIPKNLRLLNLALVDVGAGTSDIAISKEGSVVSYGMVGLAGDEITERIAQTYLLDFNGAEKLKIDLMSNEVNQFTDVLGLPQEVSTQTILDGLQDLIKHITGAIADNIVELNKKPPSAVFCIGGGAQIPGFTNTLATALGLPPERVVIKRSENLDMVTFEGETLKGPEFVTPIGIGVTAFEERDQDFIQVNVNETAIRLFNSKPLQVSDALILTGYNARRLISERGPSSFITVDGVMREVKGDYGEPAHIYINGVLANLDSRINHKDQITVVPAERGMPRKMRLSDVVNMASSVTLNGEHIKIVEYVSVNGFNRTGDYIVLDGDVIETKGIKTIRDLANAVELDLYQFAIFLDAHRLSLEDPVKSGARYTFEKYEAPILTDEDKFKTNDSNRGDGMVSQESLTAHHISVVVNGEKVLMPNVKSELVFVDVFDHIAFDLTKPRGILVLKLNGERAKYTDVLTEGDIIEIYWNN